MAKVEVELVKRVLEQKGLDVKEIASIIQDIQFELKNEVKEEKAPPVKKQSVILLSDPLGKLQGVSDIIGWVVQIPEEESPYTTEERIWRAAYDFNASPKGRRLPARSVGEACECIPARFFKEANVWIRTKEPVMAVITNNKIPTEEPAMA